MTDKDAYKLKLEKQLHKYIERKNKLLADINSLDVVIGVTQHQINEIDKKQNVRK